MGGTISVHRVRAALRGADRLGVDTVPLLQRARIPPLLLGDDNARVSAAQFAELVRELHRATDDEFLGLGPAPSRRGTFAMMCHTVIGCPDLGSALRRAVRFYGLFPDGPRLGLETAAEGYGGRAELRYSVLDQPPEDPDHFLSESLVVIWHRLSSWVVGRRIPLLWAEFAYPPPPHREEYERLFGCPCRFDAARTRAAMDADWLAAPVVRDEAALRRLLHAAPADLLSRRAWDTTVAEQVRHTLLNALRDGTRLPELPRVAAALAVSPATLRRRLAAEGTTFQQTKDAVRREVALASLGDGERIAELAARLGFSEDTAFHRAFRRWTGTTPGAYRSRG
ncbi:AraC family transcriptional regulator [Streptomyces alkaliterrae]|uniref:AraC family transcriptional regulator n=1 Tax=Streptomyces alkaliterrae TaxID=2213162 RepID=A0A5P0YT45_9ACTN|nr:AraC family transcriptional regulator [Streptomyces alkaliterrae]MBB1254516.1 AraC family transcriptional regulator [Streptomyces alkaliterrae]MBB1260449.1 AraC family transcriptional regulator [Streptomyces alkaliterrae]MQS03486.1 helix-turn-helix domain-containing protein [Streptomyces alkaliterrae]